MSMLTICEVAVVVREEGKREREKEKVKRKAKRCGGGGQNHNDVFTLDIHSLLSIYLHMQFDSFFVYTAPFL